MYCGSGGIACATCGVGASCDEFARVCVGPDAGKPDAGTPDAGTPDAGTPDAGSPDAGSMATCLSPLSAGYTCNVHCASLGLACSESCAWPAGGAGGAAAWLAGQACGCNNSGVTTCGFAWNDTVGAPPRWKCCCQ